VTWRRSPPSSPTTSCGTSRVFQATGIEVHGIAIDHVLADDTHATVLMESDVTVGGRRRSSRYADVYHVRDGTLSEHWHLPFDARAEAELYAG
jgi:hypothetical protein